MIVDGWEIGKDAEGFYAHDPTGPSTVRVFGVEHGCNYRIRTYDGGCDIPAKVMGTLESLAHCKCNPLEQTGGVHKHDCPAYQPEWEHQW